MAPKKAAAAAAAAADATDAPAAERRSSSRLASKPAPAPAPAAASKQPAAKKAAAPKPKAAAGSSKADASSAKRPAEDEAPDAEDAPAKDGADKPADEAEASASASASKKAKGANGEAKKTTTAAKGANAAGGQLKVGDVLPQDLTLKNQNGEDVKIADIKKSVIFAYPKANTPGCTTQGQCYRDAYDEYTKAGYKVFGLSNDNPTPLKNWKDKQNFQYDLISDPARDLIGKLTGSKSSTARSHFVVDADGKLVLSSVSVKPKESSEAVLKFVKEHP